MRMLLALLLLQAHGVRSFGEYGEYGEQQVAGFAEGTAASTDEVVSGAESAITNAADNVEEAINNLDLHQAACDVIDLLSTGNSQCHAARPPGKVELYCVLLRPYCYSPSHFCL